MAAVNTPETVSPTLQRVPDVAIRHIAINNYHHTFHEIKALLGHSAASIGCLTTAKLVVAHDSVDALTPGPVNVLLGDLAYTAPRLRDAMAGAPFVAWQLEPLSDQNGLAARYPDYLTLLRKAVCVWDYNAGNIAKLREWGIANTALLPFGHHPVLETVPRDIAKDIDVCFFGCLTRRRRLVLEALERAGMRIAAREKCYGAERDALIGRSRIALNLHGYDHLAILEEARISFLLANRCFVVSESSDHNPYGEGVVFAPIDSIVEVCRAWLAEPPCERERVAEQGYAAVKAQPFLSSLRTALHAAREAMRES